MKKTTKILWGIFYAVIILVIVFCVFQLDFAGDSMSLSIFFVIACAVALPVAIVCLPNWLLKKKAATYTTSATAFSKATNNNQSGSSYFIAFVLPDGTRKNMKVDVNQYNTIGEKEEGTLTYQENGKHCWFVSFTPKSLY